MFREFQPKPLDAKKFYSKCKIQDYGTVQILTSYKTEVAAIRNGEFIRIYNPMFDYSQTTLRHVNAFRATYGLDTISKAEWMQIEPKPYNPIVDMLKGITA